MQKVEGSSPFIRFKEKPRETGFLMLPQERPIAARPPGTCTTEAEATRRNSSGRRSLPSPQHQESSYRGI